jgi:hypothetical protein
MPNVYASGEEIKELEGVIHGGVTIVMHDPDELEIVADFCAAAIRSNAQIGTLYWLLNSHQLPQTPPTRTLRPHWAETELNGFDDADLALMAACSYVRDLWRTATDIKDFNGVLTVARPDRDTRLDINVNQPGLVLHEGSLIATLAIGALSVFRWSLGLFSARGIGGSARAKRVMEDFRTSALNSGSVARLERLDNLPPDYLKGKTAVIVLMHGLLSTDVGLFDPLLNYLQADKAFDDCAIVGWPHNTLAGISDNAVEFLQLFARVIGTEGPDVAFICHSRGGLLARAAIVELCEANKDWLRKLKACVTFGTPHDGSQLAEAPRDLLGKMVAIQAFRGGNGFLSLGDALHFVHQQPSPQGILDLRPLGGGGDFLKDLIRREGKFALPPVFAVGGKAEDTGFFAALSRRALAGSDNDLIVETSSSAPRQATRSLVTRCNHFEYFRGPKAQADTFADTTTFLKEQLTLNPTSWIADGSLMTTGKDVTPMHIPLKKPPAT